MKKIATTLATLGMLCLPANLISAEPTRQFLKTEGSYSELQRLQVQLLCLKIEIQERERLKEFQFHQMAQEMNRALNWTNPLDKPHVDLTNLDVFNYSLATINLDEEKQQIVVSILANQKFVDQKPGAEQRKFLTDCFRLISQRLAKIFVDYDEYRDLVVQFYPLEFDEQPFAEYKEGGYIWNPRK